MSEELSTAAPATPAAPISVPELDPEQARRNARAARNAHRLHTFLYIVAGLGASAWAYMGMLATARDGGMNTTVSYGVAGFLEVALVGSAVGARRAVLRGQSHTVYMGLTWLFSGLSGIFAALHEFSSPSTAWFMVPLRLIVPLVAALLWHVLLIGDRDLAGGLGLAELRKLGREKARAAREERAAARKHRFGAKRLRRYYNASEDLRDAIRAHQNETVIARLYKKERTRRDSCLDVMTVEEFQKGYGELVRRVRAAESSRREAFLAGRIPPVDHVDTYSVTDVQQGLMSELEGIQAGEQQALTTGRYDPEAEVMTRIAALHHRGYKQTEIADEISMSRFQVRRRMLKLGLIEPSPADADEDDTEFDDVLASDSDVARAS
jgi:hypothetical protein